MPNQRNLRTYVLEKLPSYVRSQVGSKENPMGRLTAVQLSTYMLHFQTVVVGHGSIRSIVLRLRWQKLT